MADRKIAAMHKEYGKAHGLTCKDCPNLECREMRSGRRYYKCRAYGTSCADSTDWAMSWPACGLFGKPFPSDERPMVQRLSYGRRNDPGPVEGQISMFGGVDSD